MPVFFEANLHGRDGPPAVSPEGGGVAFFCPSRFPCVGWPQGPALELKNRRGRDNPPPDRPGLSRRRVGRRAIACISRGRLQSACRAYMVCRQGASKPVSTCHATIPTNLKERCIPLKRVGPALAAAFLAAMWGLPVGPSSRCRSSPTLRLSSRPCSGLKLNQSVVEIGRRCRRPHETNPIRLLSIAIQAFSLQHAPPRSRPPGRRRLGIANARLRGGAPLVFSFSLLFCSSPSVISSKFGIKDQGKRRRRSGRAWRCGSRSRSATVAPIRPTARWMS